MASSARFPSRPGRASNWRTGGGFQISNSRNRRNAPSQLFQFSDGCAGQRDPLAHHFIDHHEARVFRLLHARGLAGRPNRAARTPARPTVAKCHWRKACVSMQRERDQDRGRATRPSPAPRAKSAAEPGGEQVREARTLLIFFGRSGSVRASRAVEITYSLGCPVAKIDQPAALAAKREVLGSPGSTSFLQIGHGNFIVASWLQAGSAALARTPAAFPSAEAACPPRRNRALR